MAEPITFLKKFLSIIDPVSSGGHEVIWNNKPNKQEAKNTRGDQN